MLVSTVGKMVMVEKASLELRCFSASFSLLPLKTHDPLGHGSSLSSIEGERQGL